MADLTPPPETIPRPSAPIKGPHPWLGPILAIVSIFVAVLWAYLQMRHWKEPEADYVAIAFNITVTLVLWILLLCAIVTTYRFRRATTPEERPRVKLWMVIVSLVVMSLGLLGAWTVSTRGTTVNTAKATSRENKGSGEASPASATEKTAAVEANAPRKRSTKLPQPNDQTRTKADNAKQPQAGAGANSGSVGTIIQGPCSNAQIGGSNNQATTNCNPVPFRTLTEAQKRGIRSFVSLLPADVLVTIGSIVGSADGNAYAMEFFPLFEGHHLDNEATPRLRTGFPASFTGIFVATVSDSDTATKYRDDLVDTLTSLGVMARKANGSKIPPGSLELLIGFRPEEVTPRLLRSVLGKD